MMAGNRPDNDDDKFLFASKGVIVTGGLIIAGLLFYIGSRDISETESASGGNKLQGVVAPAFVEQQPLTPPAANEAQKLDLGFTVGGTIAQMFFSEHDRVKAGDILASLDKAPFEKELESARARLQAAIDDYNQPTHLTAESFNAIEAARTRVEEAQYAYDTARKSVEKRRKLVVPGQEDNVYNNELQNEQDTKLLLEKRQRELAWQQNEAVYKSDRNAYKAAVEIARNHVARAEADLLHADLAAPVSGIVTSRAGSVGDKVAVGAPVYNVAVSKTESLAGF